FFQAEDGIRDYKVTGVQTCALPIWIRAMNPADLSATELLAGYRSGRLSPVEATQAVLNRIDELDSKVNAFVLVDADRALRAAREIGRASCREREGIGVAVVALVEMG